MELLYKEKQHISYDSIIKVDLYLIKDLVIKIYAQIITMKVKKTKVNKFLRIVHNNFASLLKEANL